MELFRLEADLIAKTLAPLKLADGPTATAFAYCQQWQESEERLFDHMRTVSDLVRKSGWDLLHIYQESLREAAKPFQPRPVEHPISFGASPLDPKRSSK
jgi:hypothetical protein